MKNSLITSIALHSIVVAIFLFGIPLLNTPAHDEYVIVMDVVDVSEITNIRASKKKANKNTEDKTLQKKATPPSAKLNPEADKKTEDKEQKQEEIKPKEKETEKKEEQSLEAPQIEKKKLKQEKPKEKKSPKEERASTDDELSRMVLKTLEESSSKEKPDKKSKDIDGRELKGDTNKAYNENLPLSLSEKDRIRSQIERSWEVKSFSGGSNSGMRVKLRIKLDRAGNVLDIKINEQSNGAPQYQVFVESAVRAVKIASPLRDMPAEKFGTWEEIELTFDSSGMIY